MTTRPSEHRGSSRGAVPGAGGVAGLLLLVLVLLAVTRWRQPVRLPADDRAVRTSCPSLRFDLNVCGPAELTALPGIGPRLAEAIVADRVTRGPFVGVDDLRRVHRVGPRLVDEVRGYLRVAPAASE